MSSSWSATSNWPRIGPRLGVVGPPALTSEYDLICQTVCQHLSTSHAVSHNGKRRCEASAPLCQRSSQWGITINIPESAPMTKSYADIQKQIQALTREAERVKQKEVADVVARIKDAIHIYGL